MNTPALPRRAGTSPGAAELVPVWSRVGRTHFAMDLAQLGVTDGDKGDVTVSGSGATWTIKPEAIDDRVAALLVAGSNVTLTYNDGAGTLTIASSGGGGGGNNYFPGGWA